MTRKIHNDQFSERETQRRFKAALQGAFKTSPKPLKSMTPKPHEPRKPFGQRLVEAAREARDIASGKADPSTYRVHYPKPKPKKSPEKKKPAK